MSSDLSQYLATHYLIADPKPTKKRKRKQPAADAGGLLITDEADSSWGTSKQDDDDEATAQVSGTSAEFRKAKKSSWKVVGTPAPSVTQTKAEDAAADAILASAAAESAAAGADNDEDLPVMMADGTHAGLQSAAAVSAQLERRKKRERDEFERAGQQKEAETVYRDATGRRVDVSMKRAELRRAAQDAAEKEEKKKELLRGDKQIEEARLRREQLEDAKLQGVARGVDDEDMNRELKGQTRWGDTMAQFVAKDKVGGGDSGGGGGKKMKGRPVYQGAWAPNRYGIRPGYRWDGVDRGNGFEAERFKAINRVERNKGLEYNWQMDE
ncbi:Pre-mRNA-splicing factor of RES complex-domain-containing protein [Pseudomassariella vexata]|uniref:Pre-mRNA-splicing factor of RES complex-domain-containing protein n=1 Tax=Pseudomassariella vexata TaxID=1141098 RepID=A0A1Y2E1T1_9PEZI|nr:Pre-mRNA-splicing factor of RES complex-domain-containing protein [Pseudomassariella vexata]ORY65508.1 Pre-mRNA-splicing factor of RES complex-domain-containing protein [Pseudomassariella vexata]